MYLSALTAGNVAPLPSNITISPSSFSASFIPLLTISKKLNPAIPPPHLLQPIVRTLEVRASSKWSEAACLPDSATLTRKSGVISSLFPSIISGSSGPPRPIVTIIGFEISFSVLAMNPLIAVFPTLFPVPSIVRLGLLI